MKARTQHSTLRDLKNLLDKGLPPAAMPVVGEMLTQLIVVHTVIMLLEGLGQTVHRLAVLWRDNQWLNDAIDIQEIIPMPLDEWEAEITEEVDRLSGSDDFPNVQKSLSDDDFHRMARRTRDIEPAIDLTHRTRQDELRYLRRGIRLVPGKADMAKLEPLNYCGSRVIAEPHKASHSKETFNVYRKTQGWPAFVVQVDNDWYEVSPDLIVDEVFTLRELEKGD